MSNIFPLRPFNAITMRMKNFTSNCENAWFTLFSTGTFKQIYHACCWPTLFSFSHSRLCCFIHSIYKYIYVWNVFIAESLLKWTITWLVIVVACGSSNATLDKICGKNTGFNGDCRLKNAYITFFRWFSCACISFACLCVSMENLLYMYSLVHSI